MTGFSAEWLALREPVDHASINAEIRRAFCDAMSAIDDPHIIDIGCGTGSNLRGLLPWLPRQPRWTLLDYDAQLLARAAKSAAELEVQADTLEADLSRADLTHAFTGAHAITSAAFFDLASQAAVDRIADATVSAGAVFYTVLTYDGLATWLPETLVAHRLRTSFNHHQTQDKGLGPALGPGATTALQVAFAERGYRVTTGPSPWIVTARHREMRNALDRGWADAAVAAGGIDRAAADTWFTEREASADAVSVVGHTDLLAVPA